MDTISKESESNLPQCQKCNKYKAAFRCKNDSQALLCIKCINKEIDNHQDHKHSNLMKKRSKSTNSEKDQGKKSIPNTQQAALTKPIDIPSVLEKRSISQVVDTFETSNEKQEKKKSRDKESKEGKRTSSGSKKKSGISKTGGSGSSSGKGSAKKKKSSSKSTKESNSTVDKKTNPSTKESKSGDEQNIFDGIIESIRNSIFSEFRNYEAQEISKAWKKRNETSLFNANAKGDSANNFLSDNVMNSIDSFKQDLANIKETGIQKLLTHKDRIQNKLISTFQSELKSIYGSSSSSSKKDSKASQNGAATLSSMISEDILSSQMVDEKTSSSAKKKDSEDKKLKKKRSNESEKEKKIRTIDSSAFNEEEDDEDKLMPFDPEKSEKKKKKKKKEKEKEVQSQFLLDSDDKKPRKARIIGNTSSDDDETATVSPDKLIKDIKITKISEFKTPSRKKNNEETGISIPSMTQGAEPNKSELSEFLASLTQRQIERRDSEKSHKSSEHKKKKKKKKSKDREKKPEDDAQQEMQDETETENNGNSNSEPLPLAQISNKSNEDATIIPQGTQILTEDIQSIEPEVQTQQTNRINETFSQIPGTQILASQAPSTIEQQRQSNQNQDSKNNAIIDESEEKNGEQTGMNGASENDLNIRDIANKIKRKKKQDAEQQSVQSFGNSNGISNLAQIEEEKQSVRSKHSQGSSISKAIREFEKNGPLTLSHSQYLQTQLIQNEDKIISEEGDAQSKKDSLVIARDFSFGASPNEESKLPNIEDIISSKPNMVIEKMISGSNENNLIKTPRSIIIKKKIHSLSKIVPKFEQNTQPNNDDSAAAIQQEQINEDYGDDNYEQTDIMDDQGLEECIESLKTFHESLRIYKLNCSVPKITKGKFEKLVQGVVNQKSLIKLSINFSEIQSLETAQIVDALENFKSLSRLLRIKINAENCTKLKDFDKIFKKVAEFKILEYVELSFRDCEEPSKDKEIHNACVDMIKNLPDLNALKITFPSYPPENLVPAQPFFHAIKKLKKLKKLSFCLEDFGDIFANEDNTKKLQSLIHKLSDQLESLNIDFSEQGLEDSHFATALKQLKPHMTSLQFQFINCKNISTKSVDALQNYCKEARNLRKLFLGLEGCEKIKNIKIISQISQVCTSLTKLQLGVDPKGIADLSEDLFKPLGCFVHMQSIELILSRNKKVNEDSINFLVESMSKMPLIYSIILNFYKCIEINSKAVIKILEQVLKYENLEHFEMSLAGCKAINDELLFYLTTILPNLPANINFVLNLKKCVNVSNEAKQALSLEMEKNENTSLVIIVE